MEELTKDELGEIHHALVGHLGKVYDALKLAKEDDDFAKAEYLDARFWQIDAICAKVWNAWDAKTEQTQTV